MIEIDRHQHSQTAVITEISVIGGIWRVRHCNIVTMFNSLVVYATSILCLVVQSCFAFLLVSYEHNKSEFEEEKEVLKWRESKSSERSAIANGSKL